MRDTWFNRELPVLDVIVNYDEQHGHGSFPNVELLAAETGRAKADVARAVELLDGPYIKLVKLMSGVDPGPWFVEQVYPAARVAVGQWPSPDTMIDRIVVGLNDAADRESDVARRSKIRDVAAQLGGALRDVAVDVTAAVVAKQAGA